MMKSDTVLFNPSHGWLAHLGDSPALFTHCQTESEAVDFLADLRRKKDTGVRELCMTTEHILIANEFIPVYWSVTGDCYSATVDYGGKEQSFWSKDLLGLRYFGEQAYTALAAEAGVEILL